MLSDTSTTTKIKEQIEKYQYTDKSQWSLVSKAWDICHKDESWNGGTYKDALRKSGLWDEWYSLEALQLKRLDNLGVRRFYDDEHNDDTIRALEFAIDLIENISSQPIKNEEDK